MFQESSRTENWILGNLLNFDEFFWNSHVWDQCFQEFWHGKTRNRMRPIARMIVNVKQVLQSTGPHSLYLGTQMRYFTPVLEKKCEKIKHFLNFHFSFFFRNSVSRGIVYRKSQSSFFEFQNVSFIAKNMSQKNFQKSLKKWHCLLPKFFWSFIIKIAEFFQLMASCFQLFKKFFFNFFM